MSELQLRLLGELEVWRGGQKLALPPSKKTRALLAYLALNRRPTRRDHLCELLWELPDDPRGSLRWSLSKLRRLVDDEERTRLVADRSQVGFDAEGVDIDVHALRRLVDDELASAPTEALEQAVARYQGHFLEGLELTQLHAFYAWCVSERDRVEAAQTKLLQELIDRLADEPDRALPHARALVLRAPYDEARRADLIRLLVRSGRDDEAEQQFRMGERMLREVGSRSQGLLADARHETPEARPLSAPRVAPRGSADSAASAAAQSSAEPVTSAAATRSADSVANAAMPSSPEPPISAAAPAPLHPARPLVGRDDEAQRLKAALGGVVERGEARVVLLQGEPGIGKTRLLELASELAREAGAHLLEASAFESETTRPFGLWIDALRRLGPEAAAEVFGEGQRHDRDQLLGGLTRLVERESRSRPVVIVFDDLQWCDESSAAALHYVAHMSRQRPLLGVLGAREAELTDNTAVQQALRGLRRDRLLDELRLGPLSDDAIAALIDEYAVEGATRLKSAECQGNPLLAIELARSAGRGDEGGSLQELVRERLALLDLDGADVLRWAALLAPRIDLPSLVRTSGLDPGRIAAILESAERLALLSPTPAPGERTHRFSHDLVARSIYNDIAPARRRVMHARVAELIEQDAAVDLDRAADLAHHAAQSGDPALAARAMVYAGRLCLRFFANDDALSLAARGLKWAEQLSGAERVCLTLELRDVALSAAPLDDWDTAAKEYVALAEQALDFGALAHARLGYQMASYVRWLHGQWSHARDVTLQAERVTRGASEEQHVIGMAETAKCLALLERDLVQADAMVMEARSLAGRLRLRHYAVPAALGMLHFHRGEFEAAEEALLEARALCKSAGERVEEFQANEYLVLIDLERGRLASALARSEALVEIGDKLREGSEAPFARALHQLCRHSLCQAEGDGSGCDDEALEGALDDLRATDAKHRLACVLTRAARLDVARGLLARAVERGQEALRCAEALERATDIVLAHSVLAEAFEAAGDAQAAARHRAALGAVDPASVATWARQRAEAVATQPA